MVLRIARVTYRLQLLVLISHVVKQWTIIEVEEVTRARTMRKQALFRREYTFMYDLSC